MRVVDVDCLHGSPHCLSPGLRLTAAGGASTSPAPPSRLTAYAAARLLAGFTGLAS